MVELLNSGDNKITISLPNKSGELLLPGTSIWIEKSGLGITQGNAGITGKNGAMNLYEPKAEEAREIAEGAMVSADGKAVVWRSPTQPPIQGSKSGDIWFNTSDDTIWVFDGSIWVLNSINGNSIKALSIAKDKLDNELTSELDDLDENLGILDEELQGLNLRYEDLETDFNNLQIGGRNLLLNSDFSNGLRGWIATHSSIASIVDDNDFNKVCKVEASGSNQGIYRPHTTGDLTAGETYTLSAMVKADDEMSIVVAIDGVGVSNGMIKTIGTSWEKVVFTKVSSGSNTRSRIYSNSAGTFYIAWVKTEKGTKATDWSPAPEDTEQAIAAVMTTANGKNKSYFSTSAPGTTSGTALGDIWYQRNSSGQIIGQWELTALPNTWTSRQITDSVIATLSAAKITTGTLDAERIGAGTITANHLGTDSVTANKIQAGAVTTDKIAAGAITAESAILANASVLTANIGDLQVTGAKIADATITNAKISNLDASKITTGTLDAERIGAGTITANKVRLENFETLSGKVKITDDGKLIADEGNFSNVYVSGKGEFSEGFFGTMTNISNGQHIKIDATNGEIEAWLRSGSKLYKTILSSGDITFYSGDEDATGIKKKGSIGAGSATDSTVYLDGFFECRNSYTSLPAFRSKGFEFKGGSETSDFAQLSAYDNAYGYTHIQRGDNSTVAIGVGCPNSNNTTGAKFQIFKSDGSIRRLISGSSTYGYFRPILTGSYTGNGANGRNITITGLTTSSEVIIIDASTYAALGKKPISTNTLQVSAVSGENISGRMYRYIAIII